MADPVEVVIFDLGGVLTRSPFPLLAEYATEVGLAPELLGATVRTGSNTELLARCETGEITMVEYFDEVCLRIEAEHGSRLDGARVMSCIEQCLVPLEPNVELVHEVGESHRTALLTNASTDTRARWSSLLPSGLFDVVVDSSEVGLRKPERPIFELTLSRLNVAAERTVFVDDQTENVDGAAALGIRGVVFESLDQTRRDLAALGVRVRV